MNAYNVYRHQSGQLQAIKVGWSWPGFFFGGIWAAVKGMWKIFGIIVALVVLATLFLGNNPLGNILGIIVGIVCGAYGNSWREDHARDKGYSKWRWLEAVNADEALTVAYALQNSEARHQEPNAPPPSPAQL